MRTPSMRTLVKRLTWLYRVDDPYLAAREIKTIMGKVSKATSIRVIHDVLEELDTLCQTYGVEYVIHKDDYAYNYSNNVCGFEYLNTGDTYTATIIFDYKSWTWKITSWGDLVEKHPHTYI